MRDFDSITIATEVLQLVNADLAHSYRIIPYELVSENEINFYVDETLWNPNSITELSFVINKKIKVKKKSASFIDIALSKYYRKSSKTPKAKLLSETKIENDFLEHKIEEAKQILSSDIHFEVFEKEARIRYRIDGKLIEKYKIKRENYLELVNKVKIKSNLDITEKRLPQDGRITYNGTNIRVSILPTLYGEKMVMRLLGTDTEHLSIEKVGMNPRETVEYLEALKASKGIILISGPTGSGKTTTLYASLKYLNTISSNIVTVEDPIEYTLEGINQVQLKEDIGLTFSSVLRTFLRQDPDIIMLGEIRDKETAEMAIRASLTGHLVLSTIHTNSAIGTISRLIDMGIPPFLIAETLNISIAQRLIRKLCNTCKKEIDFEPSEYVNEYLHKLKSHYIPVGCNDCYFTGYRGRQAIYELISNSRELSHEIKNNSKNMSENKVLKQSAKLGAKALEFVKNGVTSIEEVYAIISEG